MKIHNLAILWLIGLGAIVSAETYHSVKVSELDFGEDSEAAQEAMSVNQAYQQPLSIRSPVDSYSGIIRAEGGRNTVSQGEVEIVFVLEKNAPVTGFIDLREEFSFRGYQGLKAFPFTFVPGDKTKSTAERFNEIRSASAETLAASHYPGTAWFRHLAGPAENQANRRRPQSDLNASFEIFSGGRAISENLALDRELILAEDKDGKTVQLSEIKGVTVEAINWSSRLPENEVLVDALSLAVPENQHALFAKSLPDLLALIERAETELIPAAQSYSVRNPFRKLANRYKKQIGLDVATVAARLLPAKSVAVTGGDPFFPMGSDVAILMETDTPKLLFEALVKVIAVKASAAGASEMELKGDFEYMGFETKDRSFSSHVWQMGNVVAVSNSPIQIERLTAVAQKEDNALGATDEFRFFRNRYPLGAEETAFIFLSDAAIRRWAGPELRIAASRRTRAFAALGEMTSQALAGGEITGEFAPLLGETVWKNGRMISENFGTMDFMKPASELEIDSVTMPEKDAYERWRRGYERGWSQVFDPIAIRVLSKKNEIDFDLSVIPLMVDSDFREFVELCGKAELSEMARWVPEESLFHAALALDTKGERFRRFSNMGVELLPGLNANPLSWMSGSVSLDLEKSLFWEASSEDSYDRFFKAPLLVRIGSNNRLKLALFMTALKTSIQGAAPGSLTWSTRESEGEVYAVIESREENLGTNLRIYYATLSNALLVSLHEDILLRAIRREKHKRTAVETGALSAPTQMMLDSSPGFLIGLGDTLSARDPLQRLREESWKALPILNEWHRQFPGKDPVAIQFLHYGEDIFCPGGKGYRWNPEALTMESVAFGFPGAARSMPAEMPGIMDYENISTSLEFEDDGLRATLLLGKNSPRLPTPAGEKVEPVVLAKAADLVAIKEGTLLDYSGRYHGATVSMKTKITNVSTEEGKTRFTEESEWTEDGGEKYTHTGSYILDNGLFLTSESYDDGESKFEKPILELPQELVAGSVTLFRSSGRYSWIDEEDEKIHEEFETVARIRVLGLEDIEVPAGKFPGCIKIQVASESLHGGAFHHDKTLKWYHPGTGLVKTQSIEGGDDMTELEKISMPGEEQER